MLRPWAAVALSLPAGATKFDREAYAVETFTVTLAPGTTDVQLAVTGSSERGSTANAVVSTVTAATARCGGERVDITTGRLGGVLDRDRSFYGQRTDRWAWAPTFRVHGLPDQPCEVTMKVSALVGFDVVDRSSDRLGVRLELLAVGGVAP